MDFIIRQNQFLQLSRQNYCMSQFKELNKDTYSKTSRVWSGSPQLSQGLQTQTLNSSAIMDESRERRNRSALNNSKKSAGFPFQDGDFEKTTSKLFGANFSHHDPHLCVCENCQCGRHLCSFKNVKPDLSKASVYNQSFPKKTPIPNKINNAKEYEKLKGDHIAMESRHRKQFEGKPGDINERRRPEDLLKTGGHLQQLTSYSSGFPGYRGGNQYVKPTDHCVRGDIPMRARSTYASSFNNTSAPKPVKERINDNLKSTNLWLGKSTYGNFFNQPNPEDYAKKVKNVDKLEQIPHYDKQYQTTYKNSFLQQQPTGCPAKILLETKVKGAFNGTQGRFSENSDFKSLNPSFHAISTSKHCYV